MLCLRKDRCHVTGAAPGRFPDFSFERATHSVSLGIACVRSIFAPMKRITFALLALGVFATSVAEAAWDRNRLKPVSEEKKAKVLDSLPDRPLAKPKKQRRVLVFYRCEGFVHGSIAIGNYTIQELGKKTGAYLADLADEYSVFNKKTLAKYDAILFNNTTHLVFQNDDQRDALIDFLKQEPIPRLTNGPKVIEFEEKWSNTDVNDGNGEVLLVSNVSSGKLWPIHYQ